jgi:putative tryptophan/tyrosine transport system substrate-binding protein
MDRRGFLAFLSSTAIVFPLRVRAQQSKKVYRVAFVGPNGPQATMRELTITQGFMEGMRDLGYVEGKNIHYELHSAEGKVAERMGPITEELIAKGVDLIVVTASPLAKEMMHYAPHTPIVMGASTDPVRLGVVSSLARPGGNVTGFSNQVAPEIEAKRLHLLKETAPTTTHVAYLAEKFEWDNNGEVLKLAARALGTTVFFVEHSLAGHAEAFQVLENERPDALVVGSWTSLYVRRQAIYDFAFQRRVPVIYPWREYVNAGGLMSYGINLPDQYRRAADYVDKILKGANPGELPIQLPTKFDLVLNLKAAKVIGLEIPPAVLAQAAEVIE